MHKEADTKLKLLKNNGKLKAYHSDVGVPGSQEIWPPENTDGFGGWGHPADQEHCMRVFGTTNK